MQYVVPYPARLWFGQVRGIEGHRDFFSGTVDDVPVVGCPQQGRHVPESRSVSLERQPLRFAAQRLVIPDKRTIGCGLVLPGVAAVVKIRGFGRQPGDASFGLQGFVHGKKGLAPVQLQIRGESNAVVFGREPVRQVDENGLVFPRRKTGVRDGGPPLPVSIRGFKVRRYHGGVVSLGQGQV